MSQLYLQRFEYRAAAKSEFDQAWTIALQTFAKRGNWAARKLAFVTSRVTVPLGVAMY